VFDKTGRRRQAELVRVLLTKRAGGRRGSIWQPDNSNHTIASFTSHNLELWQGVGETPAATKREKIATPISSWPGSTRPSTPWVVRNKDVDTRVKPAQDDLRWFPERLTQVRLVRKLSPDSPPNYALMGLGLVGLDDGWFQPKRENLL
jgi:hypothetical protein